MEFATTRRVVPGAISERFATFCLATLGEFYAGLQHTPLAPKLRVDRSPVGGDSVEQDVCVAREASGVRAGVDLVGRKDGVPQPLV